ncbi:XdhC family protein [Psychrobacter sp. WY6]|uniref:XdhC family protein n=1 Tax=Psychrobacter sp. WY6 TaxID=2708350 RepID=UPI002022FE91|nr:XdhC family protein [Psychrobacter sp. WY6]
MNQIADILKLACESQQQSIDAVLATVVRTEGSAYRRAGAMMLICEDGRSVGMISGGCLEPHIIKRAFWLTRDGANVQVYQTGDDIEYAENGNVRASISEEGFDFNRGSDNKGTDNKYDEQDIDLDELNFGLGCNGRVHVLFERLATAMPLLNVISQVRQSQQPVTVATLIRSTINFNNQNNTNSQLQIGVRLNLDNYIKSGKLTTIDANNSDKVNLVSMLQAHLSMQLKVYPNINCSIKMLSTSL